MSDDDLRSARAAVLHWERELDGALARAASLDGPSGWMSKLLGRFDSDVEAAVADVQGLRQRLHEARRQVAEIEEGRREREAALAAAADAEVERVMEVELRLERVRAAGGAKAARLVALDAELAALEAERSALDEVERSGEPLRVLIGSVWAMGSRDAPRKMHLTTEEKVALTETVDPRSVLIAKVLDEVMRVDPPVPAAREGWREVTEPWLDACAEAGIAIDVVAVREAVSSLEATRELDIQNARVIPLARCHDQVAAQLVERRRANAEALGRVSASRDALA